MSPTRHPEPPNRRPLTPQSPSLPAHRDLLGLVDNPVTVYLASLAPGHSRRTMASALRTAVQILAPLLGLREIPHFLDFPWERLRNQHLVYMQTILLNQGKKPATVNRLLTAVKGVLRAAWKLGLMSTDDYHRTVDVRAARGQTLPAGRVLALDEIFHLLQVCQADPGPAGARDGAIIALLYGCGLRRDEIVGLRLDDLDLEQGWVRVRGKGNKERRVPLPTGALPYLKRWLRARGTAPGPLFVALRKSGEMIFRHLSGQAVYDILQRRRRQAGLDPMTPHDFRRTYITVLLDADVDPLTVAALAGHAQVQTTARYDRRSERTQQEAVQRLPFNNTEQQEGGERV